MVTDRVGCNEPGEAALVASMLSAELSHELAKTLAFMRCLVLPEQIERAGTDQARDAELLDFAKQEIARIERVLSLLRRFNPGPPVSEEVDLAAVVAQIVEESSVERAERRVNVATKVPEQIQLRADVGWLKGALGHLIRHAVASAPSGSCVMVRAAATHSGSEPAVQIDIEDAGEAFPSGRASQLFDVWQISSVDSPAFQRAAAYRLLRQLGGAVSYRRQQDRNGFQIVLPTRLEELR